MAISEIQSGYLLSIGEISQRTDVIQVFEKKEHI